MNLFNMKISLKLIVVFLLLLGWNSILRAEILVYPVPQGIYYARHNDDYTVKVRQAGEKDWIWIQNRMQLWCSLIFPVKWKY